MKNHVVKLTEITWGVAESFESNHPLFPGEILGIHVRHDISTSLPQYGIYVKMLIKGQAYGRELLIGDYDLATTKVPIAEFVHPKVWDVFKGFLEVAADGK